MAGSFAGATFFERGTPPFFPRFSRKADSSVTHIPGGNVNVTQTSGLLADRLSLVIRCTAAELTALEGKVDTTGSLIYSGGTRSAYLDEVDSPQEIAASGRFFATLKLIGR